MALHFKSVKDIVKAHRNRRSPVVLFIIVCKDINCFWETYPHRIVPILIAAIAPPHSHSHPGIWIAGSNLIKDTDVKMRSAIVSS